MQCDCGRLGLATGLCWGPTCVVAWVVVCVTRAVLQLWQLLGQRRRHTTKRCCPPTSAHSSMTRRRHSVSYASWLTPAAALSAVAALSAAAAAAATHATPRSASWCRCLTQTPPCLVPCPLVPGGRWPTVLSLCLSHMLTRRGMLQYGQHVLGTWSFVTSCLPTLCARRWLVRKTLHGLLPFAGVLFRDTLGQAVV
jgi:hypothetical protein